MADRESNLRKMAAALRDDIRNVASNVDDLLRNSRIAGITGCAVSAVSAAAAILGYALIPVTCGTSIFVAGVTVTVVGALGAATAGGASLHQIRTLRSKVKHVQDKLSVFLQALTDDETGDSEALQQFIKEWSLEVDEDGLLNSVWQFIKKKILSVNEGGILTSVREAIGKPFRAVWQFIKEKILPANEGGILTSVKEAICKPFRAIKQFIKKRKTIFSAVVTVIGLAKSIGGATCKIVRAILKGARVFKPIAATVARRVLSHATSCASIFFDLANMAYMSVQLYKGKGSNTGKVLRVLADVLDEFSQTGECSASTIQEIVVTFETAQQE